jgi:hypothetical protein
MADLTRTDKATVSDSITVALDLIAVTKQENLTVSDSFTGGVTPLFVFVQDSLTASDVSPVTSLDFLVAHVSDALTLAALPSIQRSFFSDWPSIVAPAYGTGGEQYQPQIRTEFEANYVQSRKRYSRMLMRWTLRWNAMPEADFQTLMAFFETNQGVAFNWTEPVTSAGRIVRFSMDGIQWTHINKGFRSVACELEEI